MYIDIYIYIIVIKRTAQSFQVRPAVRFQPTRDQINCCTITSIRSKVNQLSFDQVNGHLDGKNLVALLILWPLFLVLLLSSSLLLLLSRNQNFLRVHSIHSNTIVIDHSAACRHFSFLRFSIRNQEIYLSQPTLLPSIH